MNPNLDTNALPQRTLDISPHPDSPAVAPQPRAGVDDHVAHQLAALHQRGAQALGAGPGLRAAAVEVDAADGRGREGGGARELGGRGGAELDYRWGLGGVCG